MTRKAWIEYNEEKAKRYVQTGAANVNDQGRRPPDRAFAVHHFQISQRRQRPRGEPPCDRRGGRGAGLFRQRVCPQPQGQPLHDSRCAAADDLKSLFWPRGRVAGADFAAQRL